MSRLLCLMSICYFVCLSPALAADADRATGLLRGDFSSGLVIGQSDCSAAVVDSPQGNLLVTAAHCLYDPQTGKRAFNLHFIPAYNRGAAPLGRWAVKKAWVPEQWLQHFRTGQKYLSSARDVAFVRVDNKQGRNIQSVTGAFQPLFDYQKDGQDYTVYGYPANYPYNGQILQQVSGSIFTEEEDLSPNPFSIVSDFGQGVSGGPWVNGDNLFSITSYTATSTAPNGEVSPLIFAPYFDQQIEELYQQAQTGSAGERIIQSRLYLLRRQSFRTRNRLFVRFYVDSAGFVKLIGPGIINKTIKVGRGRQLLSTRIKQFDHNRFLRYILIFHARGAGDYYDFRRGAFLKSK